MNTIISTPGLIVTESLCASLWQIALWPGESRVGLPVEPGLISNGFVRTGPRTWLCLEGMPGTPSQNEGTVTDLCHSRKRFHVEGTLARDVMMRLAPLDFRDRAFADAAFKATTAHHMSVWIARDGEAWDIWVGFTFADAFRDVLEETAAQWEEA